MSARLRATLSAAPPTITRAYGRSRPADTAKGWSGAASVITAVARSRSRAGSRPSRYSVPNTTGTSRAPAGAKRTTANAAFPLARRLRTRSRPNRCSSSWRACVASGRSPASSALSTAIQALGIR
jgi:hypothetical protein